MRIGPSLRDVSTLRHAIHELLPGGDASDGAMLVASELVTNALLHGTGPVDVRVEMRGDVLRLEVDDTCPGMGAPYPDSKGMRIIDRIASAWGVSSSGAGKTVWAEVATHQL